MQHSQRASTCSLPYTVGLRGFHSAAGLLLSICRQSVPDMLTFLDLLRFLTSYYS